jgi:hypothetical protein
MENKPNTKTVSTKLTNAQFDLLIDKYIETNNIKLADGYGVEGSFDRRSVGPRHTFDLIDANDEFVATVDEKSFVALVNSEIGTSFKTNLDVVAALPE